MAGHSKWATTKRHKAVVDAKRGAVFTKLGNLIAIAARKGTDPSMNPSLAMAIEKAKKANMPGDNIKRAIARASDKSAAELVEEVYEAYGPSGIGIIIEVATDNRNRTLPEIKAVLAKNGGKLAEAGSVMFQFDKMGADSEDHYKAKWPIPLDAAAREGVERLLEALDDLDDVVEIYTNLE